MPTSDHKLFEPPKRSLTLIPAIGLILILIGYGVVIYMVQSVSKDLSNKKQELDYVKIAYDAKLSALAELDEIILEKQQALDSIDVILGDNTDPMSLKIRAQVLDYQVHKAPEVNKPLGTTRDVLSPAVKKPEREPRIYIKVGGPDAELLVKESQLEKKLRELGYSVQRTVVSSGSNNNVRYFYSEDASIAKELAIATNEIILARGKTVIPVYISGLEGRVIAGRIEIIIGSSATHDIEKVTETALEDVVKEGKRLEDEIKFNKDLLNKEVIKRIPQ